MKRFLLSLVALVITSVSFAQDVDKKGSGYNPNIVTNETATQFSNDKKLLDLYNQQRMKVKTPKIKKVVTAEMLSKRGKRMTIAGYTVGGTLLAAGIASMILGAVKHNEATEHVWASNNDIIHSKSYNNSETDQFIYIGAGAMAAGVAIGTPLIVKGCSLQKKYGVQVHSASVISQDIELGNGSTLNLGVDLLSTSQSYVKTPGVGMRFNF